MAVEAVFLRDRFKAKEAKSVTGEDEKGVQQDDVKLRGYVSRGKLEAIKRVVEKLGGDTSWIDAIPKRLSEIDIQIAELEKQISELKEEKEFLISFLSRL
ncbi:MAG TPA: hypothetical protein ENJ59_01795 [Thermofilum sp.]|nr:hypothetical protein [Thermofilum sp.]